MHILTGLLLATLLGRKKNGDKPTCPRFSVGPVRTTHVLPGRIRFRVPSLVNNGTAGAASLDNLTKIDGIESVESNLVSGSVLVRFDSAKIKPDLLLAAIVRILGLEKEMDRPPDSLVARELRDAGKSVNQAVFQRTGGVIDLWTLFFLAVAIIGIRKTIAERGRSIPTGLTLLWWSLNALKREKLE